MMIRQRAGRRTRRGAAAVELALLMPVLSLAAFGAVDVGLCLRCVSAVTECARNGAMVALDASVGPASLDAEIRKAAAAAAGDLDVPPAISWTSGKDAEGFDYVEVTASYEFHGVAGGLSPLPSATIIRKVRMMRAS